MEKHDSDSGHHSLENEKQLYGDYAQHAERPSDLDRFPDPDAGKSEEEKALIVCDYSPSD